MQTSAEWYVLVSSASGKRVRDDGAITDQGARRKGGGRRQGAALPRRGPEPERHVDGFAAFDALIPRFGEASLRVSRWGRGSRFLAGQPSRVSRSDLALIQNHTCDRGGDMAKPRRVDTRSGFR
jgi:hypothetical protein